MSLIKIDQENYLIIDQKTNQRILELKLSNHLIIKVKEQSSQSLGQGNFLMFPWISKVTNNPYPDNEPGFKDAQGGSYHGCVTNTKRSIKIIESTFENGDKYYEIELKPEISLENIHSFREKFILKRGQFQIQFQVIENEKDNNPYCFGYHPYLQLDDQFLCDLQIETNIKQNIKLHETTSLPIFPFIQTQIEINSHESYNNLFSGGTQLSLLNKKGTCVKIQSDLPFWQVYTPPDKKRIAVQPVSFCGNLYELYPKMKEQVGLRKKGSMKISCFEKQLI